MKGDVEDEEQKKLFFVSLTGLFLPYGDIKSPVVSVEVLKDDAGMCLDFRPRKMTAYVKKNEFLQLDLFLMAKEKKLSE